jgi:hypothetical protein
MVELASLDEMLVGGVAVVNGGAFAAYAKS